VNNINGEELKGLLLSKPDLDEQREVVRRVKHSFTWIDCLATEATSARKLVDHLDQAVLSKAFRGELVPQDPSDEPAQVVLGRISAERAAGATNAIKRKGRRPSI
jgi:type I restriction enzyme S subunit